MGNVQKSAQIAEDLMGQGETMYPWGAPCKMDSMYLRENQYPVGGSVAFIRRGIHFRLPV
jgi:hypothetical protein